MTEDQTIKLHLVALAEYLQTTLTDAQVKLYAKELLACGADNVVMAIALLKQDSEVWPGKFPLPAKIKSYLGGDLEHQSNQIVINILRCIDSNGHWTSLSSVEKEVVKTYGWVNLSNMLVGQRPNYITNMRSIAKTLLSVQKALPVMAIESQSAVLKELEDDE